MNAYSLISGFGLVLLLLNSFACKNEMTPENSNETAIITGELSFKSKSFEQQLASCNADTMRCATVKATYPIAQGLEPSICKNINDTIFYYLRESLSVLAVSRAEVLQSLDSIAQQFFDDYDKLVIQDSDYIIPWTVETEGMVLSQSPRLVAIQLANYSSTGEAHPNTYTTLLNFDVFTGKKLELSELIKDKEQLEVLVEEKFRTIHNIGPKEDLNEAGFFWDRDFYLPANIAYTDEGLYLYYNAYEAASYAVGATEIKLTNEELEGLLNENLF